MPDDFDSPLNHRTRPSSEIFPPQASFAGLGSGHSRVRSDETDAERWADLELYQTTLEEMALVSVDDSFREELSSIEQWFEVLSSGERTAALYTLLRLTNNAQMRFFVTVLQQQLTSSTNQWSVGSGLGAGSPAYSAPSAPFSPASAAPLSPRAMGASTTGANSSNGASGSSQQQAPASPFLTPKHQDFSFLPFSAKASSQTTSKSPWTEIARPKSAAELQFKFSHPPTKSKLGNVMTNTGSNHQSPTRLNINNMANSPLAPGSPTAASIAALDLDSSTDMSEKLDADRNDVDMRYHPTPRRPQGYSYLPDGHASWASMMNTPTQSPMQGAFSNEIINNTTMKLAALSTINGRGSANRKVSSLALDENGSLGSRNVGSPVGGGDYHSSPTWSFNESNSNASAHKGNLQRFVHHKQGALSMSQLEVNGAMSPSPSGVHYHHNHKKQQSSLHQQQQAGPPPVFSPHSMASSAVGGSSPANKVHSDVNKKKGVDPGSADVGTWLRSLRLHKYTPNLQDTPWDELMNLDDAALEAKGVNALGARRKMLKAFEVFKEETGKKASDETNTQDKGHDEHVI